MGSTRSGTPRRYPSVNKPARTIETEVLPPEPTAFQRDERLMKMVATWMDTAFVIPGTNIRFGLDPIIGLIPGAGDAADAVISSLLLARAARHGVPKIILARMALNVIVNTIFGSLPIVGDAFSIWWKSNAMNYELLRQYGGTQRQPARQDWVFVFGLIGGILLLMITMAALTLFVVTQLLKAAGGPFT